MKIGRIRTRRILTIRDAVGYAWHIKMTQQRVDSIGLSLILGLKDGSIFLCTSFFFHPFFTTAHKEERLR